MPNRLRIRQACESDRQAMAAVHAASIRRLCLGPYSREQVDAWTSVLRPEVYEDALSRKVVLVAEATDGAADKALLGLGILDPHEWVVGALYVEPSATGNGVGKALLEAMEAEAARRGATGLTVHATVNAVEFYARRGYARREDASHELPDGTALPCVRMVKELGTA